LARDELAPLHSITSSARASSGGGTVRPSALAAALVGPTRQLGRVVFEQRSEVLGDVAVLAA
jgi:hypothetical protein